MNRGDTRSISLPYPLPCFCNTTLADEFLQLLRQQRADLLRLCWLKALKSSLKPFQTFAEGRFDVYAVSRQNKHSVEREQSPGRRIEQSIEDVEMADVWKI